MNLTRQEVQALAARCESDNPYELGPDVYDTLAVCKDYLEMQKVFFAIYVECGEDTDGAKTLEEMGKITPSIDKLALAAVQQLRRDYDEGFDAYHRD